MGLGRHIRVDVSDCDSDMLTDEYLLRQLLIDAITTSGAKVLSHGGEVFEPHGAICFCYAVLADFHIWIHTYPASGQYMFDVLSCGTSPDPMIATNLILERLGGTPEFRGSEERGFLASPSERNRLR